MEKTKQINETQFSVSGTGHLIVKNNTANGVVRFNFVSVDGCRLATGQVIGNRDLLDRAWDAGRATLAMLNTTFPVKIIGKVSTIGYVTIDSVSVFRALLARAKPAR